MEPVKGGTLAKVPNGAEHIFQNIDSNASPASFAIRFSASQEGVLVVLSGMSDLAQVKNDTSYMQDFKPLTDGEKQALSEMKEKYQETWKYRCSDWSALDDNAYGVRISGIIRAYNSMLIQPDPYFSAELNYYRSFRSVYDCAFETGDYTSQTEKIGGAFDVTTTLREAVEFHSKNNYQTYMD